MSKFTHNEVRDAIIEQVATAPSFGFTIGQFKNSVAERLGFYVRMDNLPGAHTLDMQIREQIWHMLGKSDCPFTLTTDNRITKRNV